MSGNELARLGNVLIQVEQDGSVSAYAVAAFRLLLLTGCRLSEIQKLKWAWVDLGEMAIRPPDSKTGAKSVYLGEAAIDVFKNVPKVSDNPFVIIGKKPGAYLTDMQRSWHLAQARRMPLWNGLKRLASDRFAISATKC